MGTEPELTGGADEAGRRVRVSGRGDALLFVHGIGSTHAVWSTVIRHLQMQFRCVCYDLPGHGVSSRDISGLNIHDLVEDLDQVRRAVGHERLTLVGHSLGAMIAAAFTRQYPERVKSLCLLAAPAARSADDRQRGEQFLDKLRREGVKSAMSGLIPSWYTEQFRTCNPQALSERLAQLDEIPDEVFIGAYELYSRTDIDEWLDDIRAPTLVMTGEFARASGAGVAKVIADRLARSTLVVIEGLKNGILTEVPERVADEILRFQRSIS